jgi:hypothetical protein
MTPRHAFGLGTSIPKNFIKGIPGAFHAPIGSPCKWEKSCVASCP